MATADAAFLAEVENFLSSGELPSIDVKMKPSLLLPDWSISTMHPTRHSQTLVDSTQSKREVERMKDRERRRAYRARKRGEREYLRNEIERLTKELEKTKASEFESAWKALAKRQLAARLQSEAKQKHLYQAIRVQVKLAQDFQRLVYVRLNGLDDLPTIEPPEQFGASSRKRIRLESCDTEIFAAFARELGGVYARTDSTLETWGLASTEANWDAPFQSWNENVDTGFFQFRGKITMPFNYRDICQYRWHAAHLFHRQDGRELYQQVDDPDNTLALKYRVTTSLSSGELATALQRIVIRRYEENERMVLAWRLFTEGEGAFVGLHSDETGWGVATPALTAKAGMVIRTCVHNVPMHLDSKSRHEPAMKQFNANLLEWGLEYNETVTTGLQKLLFK